MVNNFYTINQDDGIFKKGMRCYCFAYSETHIFLYFEDEIISGIHEVKLPRNKIYLLKRP